MPSVFLSSTYLEMEEYRRAATEAVTRGQQACIRMEDFPASARAIPDFCRSKVAECDLFVLILGRYYGTTIPGRDISYTEDEFDAAVMLNKPRLVFILGKAALEGLDSIVKSDESRKRQMQFSRKAVAGITPRLVDSPEDLKFHLAQSINAHFGDQRITKAGEKLVHLCDRGPHLDKFADVFETGVPGKPEVYVLHGHEQEQHRHCVQRMVCRNISYPNRSSAQTLLAPPEARSVVDWPVPSDDDSEAILANRLVRNLFQALSPESPVPRENRIEAFCQLAGASQTPYLRLRHIFTPDTWTAAAQSLCLLYLRFWRDAAAGFAAWPAERKRPRILLFFEFLHHFPDAAAGEPFRQSLRSVFREQCPPELNSRVLPELPPVAWTDLNSWYERYEKLLLPQYQNRTVSELFPDAPLPMAKVERRLAALLGLEGYAD